MEIPKSFDNQNAEEKWYNHWMEQGYFHSEPDEREPYTVVIPPPNVTGVLHMGHMLNNTIQDVLVRRARMLGKNACWVPGTDHASIATEAKVVQKLRSEGVKKGDLSREEFLQHAWDWTEKHGGIILDQLKKLGASCDWDRTRFTLDKKYYESVIDVFIDLYQKGYIYRGTRMINWDPVAHTALSDEEVIHKEVNSKLFYVRYKVEESDDEWLTIATTRPETIMGDTAICVHPDDERYKHLIGKHAIVPVVNRQVPIVADAYIDPEFGTGCLKVTPAHDPNDYELGQKHGLESIDIFDDSGALNEHGGPYAGMDRFEVRKKIAGDLDEQGYLIKTEDHVNKVGYSERTDAAIEPKLSLQWFCAMEELGKPALEAVMNDTVQFHPSKFKNTYRHWMENIKDWCISRQLWWGHRIPAWYAKEEDGRLNPTVFYVAKTLEEAVELAQQDKSEIEASGGSYPYDPTDLAQDEDVLDTWFSSWIWPIAVFDGLNNENEEIDYYYPTSDLVTAPEIMFFWVARMIISGYEYKGKKPFSNVYYTGIVRDKLGRKMSKSLGNSPDPLGLIDKFGADGVRVGMLLSSPAGNDLLFDSSLCEQGRNFSNKMWNAARLVKGWQIQEGLERPEVSVLAEKWFSQRFQEALDELNGQYDRFKLSEALMTIYKLFWDDFCSWYLELVKPGYEQPIDDASLKVTIGFFDDLLKLLHPFMPFISEEIWHLLGERETDLIISEWPESKAFESEILSEFSRAAEVVTEIRRIRKDKGIANKVAIELMIVEGEDKNHPRTMDSMLTKLGNVSVLEYVTEKPGKAFSFIVGSNEYLIPFAEEIDLDEERKKLEEELKYTQGFLASVRKKLSNDRFVNNAPDQVVDIERKKESDAVARIKVLEEKLLEIN